MSSLCSLECLQEYSIIIRCNIRLELISLLYVHYCQVLMKVFIIICTVVYWYQSYWVIRVTPRDHRTSVGTMVASYPGRLTLIVFIQMTTGG